MNNLKQVQREMVMCSESPVTFTAAFEVQAGCGYRNGSTSHAHNQSLRNMSLTLTPKYFADAGAGGVELKITF